VSIRELARRHGIHRRAVRQALASPWPPPRKRPVGRPASKLGPYRPLIDGWLIADKQAPRKQRHTAKRVWERLRDECGADVAETTVRDYVRRRRRELGEPVAEVYVPQVHEPGVEAEVDWGEAEVELAGQRRRVYLFVMRACYSGASFVTCFERETQQAFLEAHVEAFCFFGGDFPLVRYDNLRSAVAKVLCGRRRVEQDRFVALRSHYPFESAFTRPGREGAHEKGAVEGEVGRFRRAHHVPVPQVATLTDHNDRLEDACFDDLRRPRR
jgi:transposase